MSKTSKKDNKLYYGLDPVPKGKTRGTMEEAIRAKQVRYYGQVLLDPTLIRTVEGDMVIHKERGNFLKLNNKAKKLISDIKVARMLYEKDSDEKTKKKDKKALDKLLVKRDALVVKLKKQKEYITSLEAGGPKQEVIKVVKAEKPIAVKKVKAEKPVAVKKVKAEKPQFDVDKLERKKKERLKEFKRLVTITDNPELTTLTLAEVKQAQKKLDKMRRDG